MNNQRIFINSVPLPPTIQDSLNIASFPDSGNISNFFLN